MNELDLLRQSHNDVAEPSTDAWIKARAAIEAARTDIDATLPRLGRFPATWRRGRPVAALLGATGGVAAAIAAVLMFTAGSAPSVAFAGWTAHPTAQAGGQVQIAQSECQRNSRLASGTPALADIRGPFTLLVYGSDSGGLCITGPSLLNPRGEAPFVPFGFGKTTITAPLAPDAIQRTFTGGLSTRAAAEFGLSVGRTGVSVTAVTLVLQNGNRVEATTSNGWFAAWWPGGQAAQTADITTTSGTTSQQLAPSGTQSNG